MLKVLNENITRQQLPQVAETVQQIAETIERIEKRLAKMEVAYFTPALITIDRIEKRLTRMESKMHVQPEEPAKKSSLPVGLGKSYLTKIGHIRNIYGDGWWNAEDVASQLYVTRKVVTNLIFHTRRSKDWIVDEFAIQGQRSKLYRIRKRRL